MYAEVLGSAWVSLPAIVRRLHQEGRARGLVAIERGRSGPARWLAHLLGFPPSGDEVETLLNVEPRGGEQIWSRRFGEHTLVSRQRLASGGLLAERFGSFECLFRLRPAARGIDYDLVGAALVLGGLRLPLPRSLSPQVDAKTWALEDAMGLDVLILAPLLGRVLRYHGLVRPDEGQV